MAQPTKKKPAEDMPVLQHDYAAERSVLGAMLLDNLCVATVREKLHAQDFYASQFQFIYKAILELDALGEPIDLVTLGNCLRQQGELEAAGGQANLAKLIDGVPRISNVSRYAKIVKDKSILRNLAYLGEGLKKDAIEGEVDAEDLFTSIQNKLFTIRDEDLPQDAVHIGDAADDALSFIEEFVKKKGLLGVSTGFDKLDELLAGWIPGELVLLGALPSEGKTALAMEFAYRQAQKGNPVVIFSLETSRISLIIRMVCNIAQIDSQSFRTGNINSEDQSKILNTIADFRSLPIWIDDRPSMTVQQFRSRLRTLAQKQKIRFAVVDYIQLLTTSPFIMNPRERVTLVSMEVKAATRELGKISNGTVMALSQLARLKGERPRLENLRESGQLEADSDVVLFIHTPKPPKPGKKKKGDDEERETVHPDPQSPHPYKEIIIAKQKNGPRDTVLMEFVGGFMQFREFTNNEPSRQPGED